MEKRLTVDLPEDTYKKLIQLQLEAVIAGEKKKSLNDILRDAVREWLEIKAAAKK